MNYYVKSNSNTKAVYCTGDGTVIIQDLVKNSTLFEINIFGEKYKYLEREWNIFPYFSFSPDEKWLIASYGIGYIYFIELESGKICKHIRLFEDVDYNTKSFEEIDTCCYYNEYTRIDFSSSGQYMVARVRGDFDPQESDGRQNMFEPIYFRSVFIFDMQTLKMIFKYNYPEGEKYGPMSLATIAFSPDEKLFVTGVLGGQIKIFDLLTGKEIAQQDNLEWIADSTGIDHRNLISFVNNRELVYVNIKKELVYLAIEQTENLREICKYFRDELIANKIIYDIEFDAINNAVNCYGENKTDLICSYIIKVNSII